MNDSKEEELRIIIISILSVVSGAVLVILASNRGNLISTLKEELVKEIGIALIIIGLASLFYDQFVRRKTIRKFWDEYFEKYCEFKSVKTLGLAGIYRRKGSPGIINSAEKNIKFLGITIRSYFNPEDTDYNTIRDLVTRGCKLQILMLNPNSPHVYYREKDEKNAKLKMQIEQSFHLMKQFIHTLPQKDKANVEIRFYDTYPLYAMTIVDDCLIRVTPFLYNKKGRQCPTSDYMRKPSGVFEAYFEHFNDLWNGKRFLFNWNEIEGSENNLFREFLKNYGIYYANDAKIAKSNDGRVITVSDGKHSLTLRLDEEKTKAILKIDDCDRTDEFIVEKENGKLNIFYAETIDALTTK